MEIAGGLYHELCFTPAWNCLMGSGGRAATVIAGHGGSATLHTYVESSDLPALDFFRDREIALRLAPRSAGISFAYFHPLARPHLEPSAPPRLPPLNVTGDTVLRFGLVEGDAIVSARRAVFDPQGWRDPLDFRANGSQADEIALVLNEAELRHCAMGTNAEEAAFSLIRGGQAAIVIVKRGISGAMVVDAQHKRHDIPAYRSERVFKIGTGDVFSALFALYWGEQGIAPQAAADMASRGVAHYAATRHLAASPGESPPSRDPVGGSLRGSVLVIGARSTLGRAYCLEEAIFRLRELGVDAHPQHDARAAHAVAALILSDGLSDAAIDEALAYHPAPLPVILLDEAGERGPASLQIDSVDDFTTALYRTAWLASEQLPPD